MTDFEAFMESRQWRPIADYVQQKGEVALFRWSKSANDNRDDFDVGYFGERPDWHFDDPSNLPNEQKGTKAFRHAQDHREGEILEHQPTEFALITASGDMDADDWRAYFMAD